MKTYKSLCLVTALLICMNHLAAQNIEKGPWWPHPLWGAGDQAGGSNWITPDKILEAMKLVQSGKVYELGQVYEPGMPLVGDRVYSMRSPASPTGGPFGSNQVIYNDDFLSTEIGQVGTQFDGPGHIRFYSYLLRSDLRELPAHLAVQLQLNEDDI